MSSCEGSTTQKGMKSSFNGGVGGSEEVGESITGVVRLERFPGLKTPMYNWLGPSSPNNSSWDTKTSSESSITAARLEEVGESITGAVGLDEVSKASGESSICERSIAGVVGLDEVGEGGGDASSSIFLGRGQSKRVWDLCFLFFGSS